MIEILSYQKIKEKKFNTKIIGFLNIKVQVGGEKGTFMVFNNIPHLEHEDRRWVAFPTYSKLNENGEKEFNKHWCFHSEDHNKQFLSKLNEKLKDFIGKEHKHYENEF